MRAPHAQAKKIEKEIWGFPRVPIELLHSALFDRLYGCILLLLDRIQHRPDWLSRTASLRPLIRPLPCSVALTQLPLLPVPADCWCRLPKEKAGRRANYAEVLVETEAPIALYNHLAKYWAVTDIPPEDPGGRATRSTTDPATGAVAAVGLPLLKTLRNLVLRKVDGVDKLSFLSVNSVGEVSVLHSLFYVGESAGDFATGDLFVIRGEIPTAGLLVVVRLDTR